jgi:hypothetical protein
VSLDRGLGRAAGSVRETGRLPRGTDHGMKPFLDLFLNKYVLRNWFRGFREW